VIAYRYSTIIYWTTFPWVSQKAIFTFRTAFSLSFAMKFQRRHCMARKFCVARGTRDTKIQVIECQFPLCISLLCVLAYENDCWRHYSCSSVYGEVWNLTFLHAFIRVHACIRQDKNRIRLVVSCRWAFRSFYKMLCILNRAYIFYALL
jgi:hypothetical protein